MEEKYIRRFESYKKSLASLLEVYDSITEPMVRMGLRYLIVFVMRK